MATIFKNRRVGHRVSLAVATLEKSGNFHLLGLKFSMKMASSSPSVQSTIKVAEPGTNLVLGTISDAGQSLLSEEPSTNPAFEDWSEDAPYSPVSEWSPPPSPPQLWTMDTDNEEDFLYFGDSPDIDEVDWAWPPFQGPERLPEPLWDNDEDLPYVPA